MTPLSILNHWQLSIGCITAISGLTIIKCTKQIWSGTALVFGGTLLAISAIKNNKKLTLSEMAIKMMIYGSIGLSVWNLTSLALVGLKSLDKTASSSFNSTLINNTELSISLNINNASLAPVFVYQSIPGSNLVLMLESYGANTLRLSKNSVYYSKVVFIGLLLFKLR